MVQGKGRKGEPSPRLANVHIITQQQIRLDLERGLKICKIMHKGERPGRSEKERIPRPLSDRLVSLIPTPHATSHSPPRTLQRARPFKRTLPRHDQNFEDIFYNQCMTSAMSEYLFRFEAIKVEKNMAVKGKGQKPKNEVKSKKYQTFRGDMLQLKESRAILLH